ncbi:MAG: AAA family ATPase [Acidimicrobiia bacterium]|nr:AAA family ATPase [Acidimicrobiia bacterium]
MKLLGWHIDACGHLRNVGVPEIDPELTVVVGPNESGKSTTHYFLRGALFGWPAGHSKLARRFRPDGPTIGGRVELLHDGRRILVERGARKHRLLTADGSVLTDLTLSDILGGATRELFEAVFAVSATELRFDGLDSDAVREKIFAAGITGGRRSARSALAELDTRRAALLRPQRGRIRERRRELVDLEAQLADARRVAGTLPDLQHAVDTAAEAVAAARATERRVQQRADHLDRLLAHWERTSSVDEWRTELAELPDLDLGPDPLGALDREVEALATAETTLAGCAGALADLTAERERVTIDDTLPPLHTRLERIADGLGSFAERRQRCTQDSDRLHRRGDQLLGQCRQLLGASAELRALDGIDVSVVARQRLDAAADDVHATRADVERAVAELDRASDHLERLGQPLPLPDPAASGLPAGTDVDQARRDLRWLVAALPRLNAARSTAANEQRMAAERAALTAGQAPATTTVPSWLLGVLGASAAGAAVVAGAGGLAGEVPVVVLAGVLAVVLAAVTFLARRNVTSPTSVPPGDGSTAAATAEGGPAVATAVAEAERQAAEVTTVAARCGFATEPRPDEVQARLEALDHHVRRAADAEDHARRRAHAVAAVEACRTAAARAEAAATDAAQAWSGLLDELGLPTSLSPDQTISVLDQLTHLRSEVDEHRSAVAAHDDALARLEADVAEQLAVLREVGGVGHTDDAGPGLEELDDAARADAIRLALRRCQDDDAARRQLADLETRIDQATRAHDDATVGVDTAVRDLAERLGRAGVNDADSYRTVVAQVERRAQLSRLLDEAEGALRAAFGVGAPLDDARAALATADPAAWRHERAGMDEQLQSVAHELDEAVRRHHDAAGTLSATQQSADVATLDAKVAALRAELDADLRHWLALSVARGAIDLTLGEFERERQPAVVRHATELFAGATGERWTGLRPGDDDVAVASTGGAELPSERLSSGTLDQLYLSMRLALAASHAEQSTALPMLLDDVLVNADDDRALAIARELARMSEQLQLILFTASERTVSAITTARPTAAVIELVDGAGTRRAAPRDPTAQELRSAP